MMQSKHPAFTFTANRRPYPDSSIPGRNGSDEDMRSIIAFLEENKVRLKQINLLPYHDIGRGKYAGLDRPYDEEGTMTVPPKDEMERLKAMFEEHGFTKVLIGG